MIVFETRLTVPKGGLSAKDAGGLGDDLTRGAGRIGAEMARNKFRELLAPGGRFNVGASGAASGNFDIVPASLGGSGRFVWQVVEGAATPANQAIREGIPPGRAVTLARLRMWAAQKGLTLGHPRDLAKQGDERRTSRATIISGYQRRSGSVSPHARATSGSSSTMNAALSAIRQALLEHGTERPSANWFKLYPQGKGRFDYPAYLSRQMQFQMAVREAVGNTARDILLTFFSSGKRLGVRGEIVKFA